MNKSTDIKHEDMIMKKAMDTFAEEGLKFFGIDKKVKDASSTEIPKESSYGLYISNGR